MGSLARRLGVLVLTGAALAGCMSGRSSLLATEEARGGASNAPDPPLTPVGGAYPVGPSRALASSSNTARASALGGSTGASAIRASAVLASTASTSTSVRARASVGTLNVSSALAGAAGPVSTRAGVGVALTPTLAPASTVGASVAAVSAPLNTAVSAQARTRVGASTTVHAAVKVKTPVLSATVHVGG